MENPPFKFVTTADGSPSLQPLDDQGQSQESMHNLNGAYAESLFIYRTALQKAMTFSQPLSICSLGLGLGYNEILTASFLLKNKSNGELESYEREWELIKNFTAWLKGEQVPKDFEEAYQWILSNSAKEDHLVPDELFEFLKSRFLGADSKIDWTIKRDFDFENIGSAKYSCIYYDAYSSKTSPQLWEEDFLNRFIEDHCTPQCVLSTYAAKGSLKRALKQNDFKLESVEGFGGKRNSTLAIRH